MINAETTGEVSGPRGTAVNGSSSAVHGSSSAVTGSFNLTGASAARGADLPAHAMGLARPPGPVSWRGLPPGPRMPYPLQIIAFLHRRRPFLERCRARYGSPFTLRFRVPPVPGVVVFKPDQIKQIFMAPPDVLWTGDQVRNVPSRRSSRRGEGPKPIGRAHTKPVVRH